MASYKLLRGSYNHGGRTYSRGDVVESSLDLLKFNSSKGACKFERVNAPTPASKEDRPRQTAEPAQRKGA
ncbi:MAG: hypothetical protein WC485_00220 [Opitutaceae bacterium]